MTKETMNVHKALSELKTLDSRIYGAINETAFITTNKHSNQKISGVPVAEFCKNMEAGHDKVTDLIRRRDAIKRAVVLSNATTKVTIAGKEYTVAEAIEMKNHGVELKKTLLDNMRIAYTKAKQAADRANGDELERRADEYVKSLYGNTDMKNVSDDVKKVRADFIAAQTVELVDPLKVTEKIEALEGEISAFMVDVDSALYVSNAMTSISVEY